MISFLVFYFFFFTTYPRIVYVNGGVFQGNSVFLIFPLTLFCVCGRSPPPPPPSPLLRCISYIKMNTYIAIMVPRITKKSITR